MLDTAIVGGGLAGASLALALARGGVATALIERQSPEQLAAEETDGRTTALAAGPRRLMEDIGVWDTLAPHAGAITDIRVSDRGSTMKLHFDHRDVGGEPMGHIVENYRLRRALLDRVAQEPLIQTYWECALTGYEADTSQARLMLDGSQVIDARLAVAADGRGSALRRFAGIGVRAIDYKQTAIVCAVSHEFPHEGIAHERFLDGGPFAILPMTDGPSGEHRSSIVWTERRPLAEHLLTLDRSGLEHELVRRFGDFLGSLSIQGNTWSYPLSVTAAKRLTGPRLALAGEAAHGMHPIAGQGFNVSVRDIECLSDAVAKAVNSGQDPGATTLLHAYAKRRWPDIAAMLAATDGLNRLFMTNLPPVALGRRLGIAAVDRIPPLKRRFQRHAMGLSLFGKA
jgi:2-octaprenyl-6-methoxyphenol hydroxylase